MATSQEKATVAVTDPAELPPGSVVDGRYRVVRVIGIGGTGIVYEVEAIFTGQRLALKTLLDPQHAPRLEQEARALARLRSPHVVKVVDFGQCEVGPYMVMTLLVGRNLRDVLESKTRLSLGFIANLAVQVCEGLDEAHRAGLIHRDLKPDNLHLGDPAGAPAALPPDDLTVVTVFDFGVVKMSTELGNNPLTRTGSTVGTPYYMSLEQLRGAGTVDAVSDVYAFCVVLYECLAGQRPFEAGTLGDLIFAICSTSPPHLHSVRPDIPRDIADTVMRGLSRDKADRPTSMRDLAGAFASHADRTFTLWLRAGEEAPSAAQRSAAAEDTKSYAVVDGAPAASSENPPSSATRSTAHEPSAKAKGLPTKSPPSGLRIPSSPQPPAVRPATHEAPAAKESPAAGQSPAAASQSTAAGDARAEPGKPAVTAPRPGLPRPPGTRSTARALPNPALLAASAMDMPAAELPKEAPAAKPAADEPAASPEAKAAAAAPHTNTAAFAKPLAASAVLGSRRDPPAANPVPAAPAAPPSNREQPKPTVLDPITVEPDEVEPDAEAVERTGSVPDRETPTEMFIPKKHGELDVLVAGEPTTDGSAAMLNLETASGQLPTMDLPTDFALEHPQQAGPRKQLRSEDKTALLDIEALQKNPPNPAPTFGPRTAPPPSPSGSGVSYRPAADSVRQSSPNLPSFADPNSVSGSYALPGGAFATQTIATTALAASAQASSRPGAISGFGNQNPSLVPSSHREPSPFVKKLDKALVDMGHAGNQFGLRVLLRFRSASQEQQIMFVVVGTATLAIVSVLLVYLIFL